MKGTYKAACEICNAVMEFEYLGGGNCPGCGTRYFHTGEPCIDLTDAQIAVLLKYRAEWEENKKQKDAQRLRCEALNDQTSMALRNHYTAIRQIADHGPTQADHDLVRMVFLTVAARIILEAPEGQ